MRTAHLLILVGLLTLVGCTATKPLDENASYWTVPPGSRLVLLKPIAMASGVASVHFQDGVPRSFAEVDRYRPYCKVEMWTLMDEARTIIPDTFMIKRVVRDFEYVRAGEQQVNLAVRGLIPVGLSHDSDSPMAAVMRTELFVDSPRQPDVYRVSCAHWEPYTDAHHLSIRELRNGLQGLFRLDI